MHADFDPEPFYTGLYNPRRPPTPEEFTMDMTFGVESLRLERLLSQPLLPHYCHGNHWRNHRSSRALFLG